MKGLPAKKCGGDNFRYEAARASFSANSKCGTVIFFDIDDTLIDQRQAEAKAARQLLTFYGDWLDRPYSLAEFCSEWRALREKHNAAFFAGEISLQEQRRRRVRELFARCHKKISECEVDKFFAFYEYQYRKNWTLFDDVLPCFRSLRGFICGIISNGSRAQQRLKLLRAGIARYFDVVVVAEEVGAAKPDREIFLAACEQARCPVERCVYVGDSLDRDALASRAAGMRSFWLDRAGMQKDAPVQTIASLTELGARLARERKG